MSHNVQVLVLFVILIALWFFKVCVCKVKKSPILRRILQTPIFMPGWGDAFKVKTLRNSLVTVGSATPAIFMSILLFILPQVQSTKKSAQIL